MGEIAYLEKDLLLAASVTNSRQCSEQIIEQGRDQDNEKCSETEIVQNVLSTIDVKKKSDNDINGSVSKLVSVASKDMARQDLTNKVVKKRHIDENDSKGLATSSDGYADIVATHYNQIEEKGLDERSKSRIVYLRNFHNWIKSMLINEYLTKIKEGKKYNAPIRVHDMCCGKGGDLLKWRIGGITHLICSDIASVSLDHCMARYNKMKNFRDKSGNIFSIEYILGDCTRMRLREKYSDPSMKLDLVSCQFAFHYSFESLPQAECMFRNAAECLQPGGYFIGTMPDADDLIARAKRYGSNTYGNDVYQVTLDFELDKTELFGSKYNFLLDGRVDCPEFLVYFPMFVKLAKKFGLKFVKKEKFYNFYERMKSEGRYLLSNMRSLEAYPPYDGATLVGTNPDDYRHADEFIKTERNDNLHIGTLSKSEWEASSLYTTFVFEKVKNTWNKDGTPVYDI